MPEPVSVLLSSCHRPHNLRAQIEAVRAQSYPVREIVVFANANPERGSNPEGDVAFLSSYVDHGTTREVPFVFASNNTGVWTRFTIALELVSPYVAVFDDDTIPGPDWLDNAMQYVSNGAVCGTNGVVFPTGQRSPRQYVGCGNPNEEAVEVDIVGHCWVMHRELLVDLARLYRPKICQDNCPTAGEDYCLSYCAQHLGLKTIVPAHPKENRACWGSVEPELGRDEHALWKRDGEEAKKQAVHDELLAWGWKTLYHRSRG